MKDLATTVDANITSGAQPSLSQTRTRRYLQPRDIATDAAFQFRETGTDKAHAKGLAQTLRTVGELDPVLVWQELEADGKPTGRLVLLDGHHRLAAYATAKRHHEGVPAVVLTGDRTAAMLAAVQANTRDSLPLTKKERMDAAWRLVRLPGKRLSVPTVAKAAGVGAATVDRMRKRWVEIQAQSKEASGQWWRDRQDELPEMKDRVEMTDAERKAAIRQLAEAINKALGKMPWQDQNLAAEALLYAIGTYKLRSMADYLFSTDDDEFAEDQTDTFAITVPAPEEDTAGQDF